MIHPPFLTSDAAVGAVTWQGAVGALRRGHLLPKAQIADTLLGSKAETLLNRSAYIEGLGFGVKAVTVIEANAAKGIPTVQGAMLLYEPGTGAVKAIIDGRLVTEYKTAADSVLGALLLARPDSRHLLIVGAGVVAASLARAYKALFPKLERISIWARRLEQSQILVSSLTDVEADLTAAPDLKAALRGADIVSAATMAREPVLFGDWIRPGTHVDLIGAFKPDMREADDTLMKKGLLFVDSRDTTIDHIGELILPIASGAITRDHVRGDFYDLVAAKVAGRPDGDSVTIFKNGGGAHLDLMVASYIAETACTAAAPAS